MGVLQVTDTEIVWQGPPTRENPSGITRLSRDEYEVDGGTVRRRFRPAAQEPHEPQRTRVLP